MVRVSGKTGGRRGARAARAFIYLSAVSKTTPFLLGHISQKLRRTAHQVAHPARVLSAVRSAVRSLRILAVGRSKTVEESKAGRGVLEEFRDVVLDGGAVLRGCQQVFPVLGEMDTAYGVGVVA